MATGYVKLSKWCEKNNIDPANIRRTIKSGKITCAIKRNGLFYLPVDYSFQDSEDGGIIETVGPKDKFEIPTVEELYKQYKEIDGEGISLDDKYTDLSKWQQRFEARVEHLFLTEMSSGEYNPSLYKDVGMIFTGVKELINIKKKLIELKIESTPEKVETEEEKKTKEREEFDRMVKQVCGDRKPTKKELFNVLNFAIMANGLAREAREIEEQEQRFHTVEG